MEQEQIEVVGGEEETVGTTEEVVEAKAEGAEVAVSEAGAEATTSSDGEPASRVLQPLHPLRKIGRWQNYSGTSYVEGVGGSGGDHHYLEPAPDNHVPPPVGENIVVTSDDVMGEMISVTDVVEEEVKTSHSPHHLHHHLEPNLPPGSLVKVEVVLEDGSLLSEDQKAAYHLTNHRLVTAEGMDPQWPEHPEPSPPLGQLGHLSQAMPSTSTILIPAGHRLLSSSSAATTTTFVYARPAPAAPAHNVSPGDRIDETVNEVVSSVMGRGGPTYVRASGLPSFTSIMGQGGAMEVVEEVPAAHPPHQPPPPMPSVGSRPSTGPVTIVKTRRPRSQLTDEDRRFRCTYCDKAFTARSSLDVHERIHTGERPYKCTECGKTFRHCGHLTCHLRTHTGERPYVCRVCGKGFTQSTPCRRHEQTQHNLSP